jgi:hypothetical protein
MSAVQTPGRYRATDLRPQPPLVRDAGRHRRIRPGEFLDDLLSQGVRGRVFVEDGDDRAEQRLCGIVLRLLCCHGFAGTASRCSSPVEHRQICLHAGRRRTCSSGEQCLTIRADAVPPEAVYLRSIAAQGDGDLVAGISHHVERQFDGLALREVRAHAVDHVCGEA